MRKILLFGGGGFVGGNLAHVAMREGWNVCVADQTQELVSDAVGWRIVDITSEDAVDSVITDENPDAVVNVAAIANIDFAEREKELTWKVNVDGARNVAKCCAERGVRYVFFSSDAVFDGHGCSYAEENEPAPVNYYGVTKAEAEKAVLSACPEAVIARLSLVLGFPVNRGNSFFAGLHAKLNSGQEVPCPVDEVRTPVDVITLSECVLELAGSRLSGIFHIGATDHIGRYDLTRKLARRMGFDESLAVPVTSEKSAPGRAPRHKNGIISVSKAQRMLKTQLLTVDEGIDRAFRERISPGEV